MALMNFEEMKRRYDGGEDSLELALEKWERIFKYCRNIFHIAHYQEILKAAVVPIFLCTEYVNQCHLCPIYTVCQRGNSEAWTSLMRLVQAYAIAGDMLPKTLMEENIELFVEKLRMCRENTMDRVN